MDAVLFQRRVPIRHKVDVFVAGGGPAGVAAAVAVRKKTDTRGVPVSELQKRLKDLGAYLPNAPG